MPMPIVTQTPTQTPTRMQTVTPTRMQTSDADADGSPGDGSPGDGSPGDAGPGDDGTIGDGPGETCGDGMVYDCSMACVSRSSATAYVGDGYCDDGTSGMDLMCERSGFDGGDCTGGSGADADNDGTMPDEGSSGGGGAGRRGRRWKYRRGAPGDDCGPGMVYDCAMACVARSTATGYVGDGYCDDGTFGVDLMCSEYSQTGGDCEEGWRIIGRRRSPVAARVTRFQ